MEHTFSAGRYYIGDPCYVIEDENWDNVLKETGCFGYEPFSGIDENYYHLNGKVCWAHSTAWGDGTYFDNKGEEYWVDAGLLGVIPAEALEGDLEFRGGYGFTNFDKPFTVEYDEGTFKIGDIIIPTDDTKEEPVFEEDDEYN